MDKFTITEIQKPGSRKNIYRTVFEIDGSLDKIINYLKTNKSPNIIDGIRTISVNVVNDSEIERIMTCALPNDSVVSTAIGNEPVHVKYEIAHGEGMLVSKAVHPEILNKFFKFTEMLTITEDSGKLFFERESTVFNFGKQIPFVGSSYQTYDDFFNRCNLEYYYGIAIEANCN